MESYNLTLLILHLLFLHKLLTCWSKVNLWSNLTPKSFSQRLFSINEFPIWIWFESSVLNIKWHFYVLPFIWLYLKHLSSYSADVLSLDNSINVVKYFIQGVVVSWTNNVNIIQNMKKITHAEKYVAQNRS